MCSTSRGPALVNKLFMASDAHTKGIEELVNEHLMWCMVWDLWLMFNPGMVEILWFMVYDDVHSSAASHACAVTRLACYVTALPYLKGACRGCSQEVCGAAGHYLCFVRFAALLHYCYTRAPCDCDNHERSQRTHLAFTPWAVQRMPNFNRTHHARAGAHFNSLRCVTQSQCCSDASPTFLTFPALFSSSSS